MTSSGLHKIFVYGTLKKGEPNHNWFSKSTDGYYKYICDAKTVEKFPLIIATKYNVPLLLHKPGEGKQVKGELYEVDDKVLAQLDILEDYPKLYAREKHDVTLLDGQNTKENVWIYTMKNFKDNLLQETVYESYSSWGSHGRTFQEAVLNDIENVTKLILK